VILFDTSVVLDARDQGGPFFEWSQAQIAEAASVDAAGVNTIVLSEASVRAVDPDAVPELLERFGMTLLPLPVSAAVPAAKAFAKYLARLKKEGKTSIARAPLPDFLVGAHAEAEGFKLVTRDPDRIRAYFPNVELITP
jgi:hypothetical protein